jgi:hypothetical protein
MGNQLAVGAGGAVGAVGQKETDSAARGMKMNLSSLHGQQAASRTYSNKLKNDPAHNATQGQQAAVKEAFKQGLTPLLGGDKVTHGYDKDGNIKKLAHPLSVKKDEAGTAPNAAAAGDYTATGPDGKPVGNVKADPTTDAGQLQARKDWHDLMQKNLATMTTPHQRAEAKKLLKDDKIPLTTGTKNITHYMDVKTGQVHQVPPEHRAHGWRAPQHWGQ